MLRQRGQAPSVYLRVSVCPPGGEEGLLSLDQQYSVLLVPQSLQSLIHRAAGARSGDALVE